MDISSIIIVIVIYQYAVEKTSVLAKSQIIVGSNRQVPLVMAKSLLLDTSAYVSGESALMCTLQYLQSQFLMDKSYQILGKKTAF